MPTDATDRIRIDVRLERASSAESDAQRERDKVRRGLLETPRRISPKYFYDDRGSELFERITELPEYYQTRTERALLESIAPALVEVTGACELVELGSGASTKTRVLLDAFAKAGILERYVPFDVSEGIVRRVAEELVKEYPGLEVHGVIGDFLRHLGDIPDADCRLILFLGGTIGNLRPEPDAREFLTQVADSMGDDDFFLLGADLIKSPERLNAAYNDSQGVTAEFNRNILRVLNDNFDGDFEPRIFRHHAFFNETEHRVEMWLEVMEDNTVELKALDLTLDLEGGEEIQTEISTKYDRDKIEQLLERAGFELVEWYTDPDSLFSLSLARKRR